MSVSRNILRTTRQVMSVSRNILPTTRQVMSVSRNILRTTRQVMSVSRNTEALLCNRCCSEKSIRNTYSEYAL